MKIASQYLKYWLTISQWCKTSINLQLAKQCLFSLTPEAAVHICYTYRCSKKSRKIHGKTSVPESLFNKGVGLRPSTLLKRHSSTAVFLWIYNKFLITTFSQILSESFFRSSHTEPFWRKDILKICSKFTGEHPCRSVISIKLPCNFIETTLRHGCSPVNLLHIFRTPFTKNTSGGLLLPFVIGLQFYRKRDCGTVVFLWILRNV